MNCPNCHHPIDTAEIPDADLQSEVGRRRFAKRVNSRGGRPTKPTKCPKCPEILPSYREALAHCRNKRG